MSTFENVREIMAAVLGVEPETLSTSTQQHDVPEWDSVGHLNLMLALEESFPIRLDIEDIQRLSSVSAILDYLDRRCPSS